MERNSVIIKPFNRNSILIQLPLITSRSLRKLSNTAKFEILSRSLARIKRLSLWRTNTWWYNWVITEGSGGYFAGRGVRSIWISYFWRYFITKLRFRGYINRRQTPTRNKGGITRSNRNLSLLPIIGIFWWTNQEISH